MRISIFILLIILLSPVLVFAQDEVKPPVIDCNAADIPAHFVGLCNILGAFNIIIAILIVVAIAFFIWGIAKYLTSGGDENKAKSAKNAMIYGVIGLAVIFGVNFIISYIAGFLGVEVGSLISFFKS